MGVFFLVLVPLIPISGTTPARMTSLGPKTGAKAVMGKFAIQVKRASITGRDP